MLLLNFRSSALRSSQNSLQSNITSNQRPASAYYPPASGPSAVRSNLHQSIPNLKSPPSTQQIHSEETRSGSFPSVNQQHAQAYNQSGYGNQTQTYPGQNPGYVNQNFQGQNQNFPSPNYPKSHEEINKTFANNQSFGAQRANEINSYPSPNHNPQSYPNNLQQPLHINANGQRAEEIGMRYSNTGLLREDVFRHSQNSRSEEMMRYPSTSNVKIQEAQIQQNKMQDDLSRNNEMRTSKSEDMLRHHSNQNDMLRYASSGNIRAQESNKIELPQLRQSDHLQQNRLATDERSLRGKDPYNFFTILGC